MEAQHGGVEPSNIDDGRWVLFDPRLAGGIPSEQALTDATRVVLNTQEAAGIDIVCDGELYRFDVNHPETNGMIEYFVRPTRGFAMLVKTLVNLHHPDTPALCRAIAQALAEQIRPVMSRVWG